MRSRASSEFALPSMQITVPAPTRIISGMGWIGKAPLARMTTGGLNK